MPIILDDLSQTSGKKAKQLFIPKFFGEHLTGSGKKAGVLSEITNPKHISTKQTTSDLNINCPKQVMVQGPVRTMTTPLNPLQPTAWGHIHTWNIPLTELRNQINVSIDPKTEIYITLDVHSVTVTETDKDDVKEKIVTPCFQLKLFLCHDLNHSEFQQIPYKEFFIHTPNQAENYFSTTFTCNPKEAITKCYKRCTALGYSIDPTELILYADAYSTFDGACIQSETWQSEKLVQIMEQFCQNVATHANKDSLNALALQMRYLENYNIPLHLYRDLYQIVNQKFSKDIVKVLCKQNLNLLLSDTLHSLDANKPNLSKIPKPSTKHAPKKKFSPEQMNALTTVEPLTLVQAGAGTGKSTVILGRIDYLIESGVAPEDITVLSFTNAAANNIQKKQPRVHSMTISYMVHSIYSLNFPMHDLSSIQTIINSLSIYYPDQPMAKEFATLLTGIMDSKPGSFTKMNNFIETNYDFIIQILNTLKQTCLELEIIICYQQIENLIEPIEVASKFLIIDEVQDNSIFDFIYTLKYTDKHQESLFIVGDCSQTLYEFRASNPRALNVLEGSGVFATYQLKVNYRSNQEILDFANIALQNIEANQYAKIQLQANNLNKVTAQSFQEKVTVDYIYLEKMKEFKESLGAFIATNVKPYIDDKIQKGEQVAILAYARKDIAVIEQTLQRLYPTLSIVNIIPTRIMGSTVFSNFIKKFWNEVKFIPTDNIPMLISQMIIARLDKIVFSSEKMLLPTQKMLENWRLENEANINSWQMQYNNGQLTLDQVLDSLRDCMLQYEIRTNAIKQALLSSKNEENKNAERIEKANILLSTIHSAKGLEFPHTVVLYKNDNKMAEDKKRMYYVALTRAMQSEYILAYDTQKWPAILADYNTIIDTLNGKTNNKNKTKRIVISNNFQSLDEDETDKTGTDN